MDENEMKSFADALWGYYLEKHLKPYLSDSVCYFMATVTAAPSGGVIGVQRPYDDEIFLPYAWSAANLQPAQTCLVLVFGDLTNAIVLGAGDMGNPGIPRVYTFAFTSAEWTQIGTMYSITVAESTHNCGANPAVDVYMLVGSVYQKYYGMPSAGWTVSVNTSGDVTLTASAAFGGKLVIR